MKGSTWDMAQGAERVSRVKPPQVPGHDGLAYLNKGVIDDVMEHRGVVVQGLPINHTKSPDRWKNVRPPAGLAPLLSAKKLTLVDAASLPVPQRDWWLPASPWRSETE